MLLRSIKVYISCMLPIVSLLCSVSLICSAVLGINTLNIVNTCILYMIVCTILIYYPTLHSLVLYTKLISLCMGCILCICIYRDGASQISTDNLKYITYQYKIGLIISLAMLGWSVLLGIPSIYYMRLHLGYMRLSIILELLVLCIMTILILIIYHSINSLTMLMITCFVLLGIVITFCIIAFTVLDIPEYDHSIKIFTVSVSLTHIAGTLTFYTIIIPNESNILNYAIVASFLATFGYGLGCVIYVQNYMAREPDLHIQTNNESDMSEQTITIQEIIVRQVIDT